MPDFTKFIIFCYLGLCLVYVCNSRPLFTNETCLPLDECPHLKKIAIERQIHFGTINLLQKLSCDEGKKRTHVRCISFEKADNFIKKAELLPNFEDCGNDIIYTTISKGEKCELNEFPWIALLKYLNNRNVFKYGCQGNLISKKYLITAAHCVSPEKLQRRKLTLHSVVLGEYDIINATDCVYTEFGKDCADPVKEYTVESIHMHPEYNSTRKIHDIALLRLKNEVEFSSFIQPICLPLVFTPLERNMIWWVAGWGETEDQVLNRVKVKAKFALQNKSKCPTSVTLTDYNLCVASVNDSKTCPGDSGGPLMMKKNILRNNKILLIGIDSLGVPDCSIELKFSIFTRTSAYIDWIISTLEE